MNNSQYSSEVEFKERPFFSTFRSHLYEGKRVNKLVSRETLELLTAGFIALIVVRFYNNAPLSITMAALGAVIAVPILVKKTEYAVLFLAIILPFQDVHIISIIHFKRLIIWSISVVLALQYFMKPPTTSTRNLRLFTKFFFVFILALIVSFIKTASDLYMSQFLTPTMLKSAILSDGIVIVEGMLIVYLVYHSFKTLKQIKALILAVLLGSALVAGLGIIQYYLRRPPALLAFLYDEHYEFYGRAVSVFSNPNYLGSFLASMVIIALACLIWGPISKKIKCYFILPVLLLDIGALLLTFSRGATLQVFFGIIVAGFLYYRTVAPGRFSWKIVLMAILFLGLLFAASQFYGSYMRIRLSNFGDLGYEQALFKIQKTNDFYRRKAAIKAFQVFVTHPIFGVGYRGFSAKGFAGVEKFGMAVHNQYLKILAEMGLFGFIPFLLLLWVVLKTCREIWNDPQNDREIRLLPSIFLSGMSAIILGYFFADFLSALSISGYLWVFSGAIFAIKRLSKRTETGSH